MSVTYHLYVDQGATFSTPLVVRTPIGEPRDLTGFSLRAHMRRSYYVAEYTEINVTATDVILGNITLSMDSATTKGLKPARYVYDVEIYNDTGYVERIYEGIVVVSPEATKEII